MGPKGSHDFENIASALFLLCVVLLMRCSLLFFAGYRENC